MQRYNKTDKIIIVLSLIGILDSIIIFFLLHGGINLGTILPFILGIALFTYVMAKKTKLFSRYGVFFKRAEKLAAGFFSVWIVTFIIFLVFAINSSVSNKSSNVDCMLILGAGLRGEKPSLVLIERLNLALDYLESNNKIIIIVSGGKGTGEDITEAEAMKRYLIDKGIAESRIFKEEKSTSTIENIKLSEQAYRLISGKKLESMVIVTNDFHMLRARILANRVGIKAYGISAKTPVYLYPNVYIREYFALIKSYLFDK